MPVCTCVFLSFFLDNPSDKDESVYQTWVFFYPALHCFIDLSTVTLKGPENHRSTKQGSVSPLHLKDSLGPGWYHSQHWQAALVLLPGGLNLSSTEETQNIKLPWAVNFLALSIPHICLILCLFLCVTLSFRRCVSWLSASGRSLQKQQSGQFFFNLLVYSNLLLTLNIFCYNSVPLHGTSIQIYMTCIRNTVMHKLTTFHAHIHSCAIHTPAQNTICTFTKCSHPAIFTHTTLINTPQPPHTSSTTFKLQRSSSIFRSSLNQSAAVRLIKGPLNNSISQHRP